MFPLSLILGSVGALLIAVGVVGGDFTFSGSVIPKIGAVARVVSFSVGAVLVVTSLGVFVLDPAVHGPPDPAPTPAQTVVTPGRAAPDDAVPVLAGVDQQVVQLLHGRPSFADTSGADLVSVAHAECGVLQRGGTGSDVVEISEQNGVSHADAIYALAVSVWAYCDGYTSEAGR